MASVSREVRLLRLPDGLPKIDDFDIVETKIPMVHEGELLIRNLYLSVDPYIRPRLSNGLVKIGQVLDGHAVGQIIETRNQAFPAGQLVLHRRGFREYSISNGEGVDCLDIREESPTVHLGVLGMTGLTAYAGLLVVAQLKDGERVFVSAAAGAVGSVAVQIAKLKNCWVMGSAGTEAKCDWLRKVAKIDAVVNYKEGNLRKSIKDVAGEGIDVFFDNVGGEQLNATLPRMRMRGRIALCGMIASYNNKGALSEGITTLSTMMYNRLRIEGFIQSDYSYLRPQFYGDMRKWINDGRMRYEETIVEGIEQAPSALIGLFLGKNLGKMLVRL
jgi:NADPH-dependent curcumin reductase CurA